MRYVDIVDNLKVRLGYGLAGNQGGISSYTPMNLAKPNVVTPVGNLPMVTFETLRKVNPNLKWEVKKTFNAGADLEMYDHRRGYNAYTRHRLVRWRILARAVSS